MQVRTELELLRATLGDDPTELLMVIAAGNRRIQTTPDMVYLWSAARSREKLEAAGLIWTTPCPEHGYHCEIVRPEDLPMIHLALESWLKRAYERRIAAASHSARPTTDQYRDLDLESLRAKLGRGPTNLLVWLVLFSGTRPDKYLCSSAEPELVGPITAEILARQAGGTKASFYAWRRKLQALGLVSVAEHGNVGCTYKILVTGDPHKVFEQCVKQACHEEEKAGSCEPSMATEALR